jgi:hypothetical protein
MAEMIFHRLLSEAEFCGKLFVGESLRLQVKEFPLTRGQDTVEFGPPFVRRLALVFFAFHGALLSLFVRLAAGKAQSLSNSFTQNLEKSFTQIYFSFRKYSDSRNGTWSEVLAGWLWSRAKT